MIPINCIRPLLRYFSGIDYVATGGLVATVPDEERTITQNLCKLLDPIEQDRFDLKYRFPSLVDDLQDGSEFVSADFQLQTHEYKGPLENRITQSDLGLVINYRDYVSPEHSWTESWLMQAKVLKHAGTSSRYTEASTFGATDSDQLDRIEILGRIAKCDFIRLMHYCPPLGVLRFQQTDSEPIISRLIHQRNVALAQHIFDYALGLELRDSLIGSGESLDTGIFISDTTSPPQRFDDIYRGFFRASFPFSWFILWRLAGPYRHWAHWLDWTPDPEGFSSPDGIGGPRMRIDPHNPIPVFDTQNPASMAHGIASSRRVAIEHVMGELGDRRPGNFRIFPARTITVGISAPIEERNQGDSRTRGDLQRRLNNG